MLIAITGAGGSIGKSVVPELLKNNNNRCRLLLRDSKKNRKLISCLQKEYGDRIGFIKGDVTDPLSCEKLVKDTDYVLHLAAVIPPKADHDDAATWKTNLGGTVNLVNAIIQAGNTSHLIFFSTVAVYGHRGVQHHWGRVGDPLMPSIFDAYGASKVQAERYILESELKHWIILRETGVLYDNLMMNNISDGLMFQTPVNVFIEWVTAKDTARLLNSIISSAQDMNDFWNQIYNIGGGISCRQTGFETYNDGFKLIGGSAKKIFEPRWHNQRNFHCFWFSDSDVLEDLFHFRSESTDDFWKWFAKKHRVYSLGRILPPGLIKSLIIKPLLKNSNAPAYWVENNNEARITAVYGSRKQYEEIPKSWDQVDLICEHSDYEDMKIHRKEYDLSHGYDESKDERELNLADMQQAAAFRGGKVLSDSMQAGDLKTKLKWQCHNGHEFESSPYTIIKAGHWCPICCSPKEEWTFDELSKHIPFFAQLWYDTHSPEENYIYSVDENGQTYVRKNDSVAFAKSEEI